MFSHNILKIDSPPNEGCKGCRRLSPMIIRLEPRVTYESRNTTVNGLDKLTLCLPLSHSKTMSYCNRFRELVKKPEIGRTALNIARNIQNFTCCLDLNSWNETMNGGNGRGLGQPQEPSLEANIGHPSSFTCNYPIICSI